MKHENNGACPKCKEIIDRYPGFHPGLREWFESLQKELPEVHTSEAGRGAARQFECLKSGASKAKFGKSAHNYNAALDLFELSGDIKNIYEKKWFNEKLAPRLKDSIEWYGKKGAPFFELPHVELKGWRQLVKDGKLKLVEEPGVAVKIA
jgi:hypothetical protein